MKQYQAFAEDHQMEESGIQVVLTQTAKELWTMALSLKGSNKLNPYQPSTPEEVDAMLENREIPQYKYQLAEEQRKRASNYHHLFTVYSTTYRKDKQELTASAQLMSQPTTSGWTLEFRPESLTANYINWNAKIKTYLQETLHGLRQNQHDIQSQAGASAPPWQAPASAQPWQAPASAPPWQAAASAQPWQAAASAQPWQAAASAPPWQPQANQRAAQQRASASAPPWQAPASAPAWQAPAQPATTPFPTPQHNNNPLEVDTVCTRQASMAQKLAQKANGTPSIHSLTLPQKAQIDQLNAPQKAAIMTVVPMCAYHSAVTLLSNNRSKYAQIGVTSVHELLKRIMTHRPHVFWQEHNACNFVSVDKQPVSGSLGDLVPQDLNALIELRHSLATPDTPRKGELAQAEIAHEYARRGFLTFEEVEIAEWLSLSVAGAALNSGDRNQPYNQKQLNSYVSRPLVGIRYGELTMNPLQQYFFNTQTKAVQKYLTFKPHAANRESKKSGEMPFSPVDLELTPANRRLLVEDIKRKLYANLVLDNLTAKENGYTAYVRLDGIGTGAWAGDVSYGFPDAKAILREALEAVMREHHHEFSHIASVELPFHTNNPDYPRAGIVPATGDKLSYSGTQFTMLRKLDQKFSGCKLISYFAWDGASLTGNEGNIGQTGSNDPTGVDGTCVRLTHPWNTPEAYDRDRFVIINGAQAYSFDNQGERLLAGTPAVISKTGAALLHADRLAQLDNLGGHSQLNRQLTQLNSELNRQVAKPQAEAAAQQQPSSIASTGSSNLKILMGIQMNAASREQNFTLAIQIQKQMTAVDTEQGFKTALQATLSIATTQLPALRTQMLAESECCNLEKATEIQTSITLQLAHLKLMMQAEAGKRNFLLAAKIKAIIISAGPRQSSVNKTAPLSKRSMFQPKRKPISSGMQKIALYATLNRRNAPPLQARAVSECFKQIRIALLGEARANALPHVEVRKLNIAITHTMLDLQKRASRSPTVSHQLFVNALFFGERKNSDPTMTASEITTIQARLTVAHQSIDQLSIMLQSAGVTSEDDINTIFEEEAPRPAAPGP